MPIYEYKCPKCGKIYEITHKFDDHTKRACLDCVADLQRVYRLAGVNFKGSGFYSTDKK